MSEQHAKILGDVCHTHVIKRIYGGSLISRYKAISRSTGEIEGLHEYCISGDFCLEFCHYTVEELIEDHLHICKQLIGHVNVQRFIRDYVIGDNHYLSFEFGNWYHLLNSIQSGPRFSTRDACRYFAQILEGVRFCHDKNIIHRVLHPGSLFLTGDMTVKICHLDAAVETDGKEKNWYGVVGPVAYLAPEVANFEGYGKPVDMWACGVLLYIMLVGIHPFWSRYHDWNRTHARIALGRYDTSAVLTEPAKEFLSKLLAREQDERITAGDSLNHPFLNQAHDVDDINHRVIVFDRLKNLRWDISVLKDVAESVYPRPTRNAQPVQSHVVVGEESDKDLTIVGFSNLNNEPDEVWTRKSEIMEATRRMIRSVMDKDYDSYVELSGRIRTCSGFGTGGFWKRGLEFNRLHADAAIKDKCIVSKMVTLLNPVVNILSEDAAYVCLKKIVKYVTGRAVVVNCFSETRVLQHTAGRWSLLHVHCSEAAVGQHGNIRLRV